MIKLDRLRTWLSQTGTQKSNQPLYQILFYLIDATRELQGIVDTNAEEAADAVSGFEDLDFLTHGDESATLPNSRQLISGTNITFDDSVANQRTISASGGSSDDYVVMSDGAVPPSPMDDGGGNFIYVTYSPP